MFEKSDSIAKLAEALSKAQGEIEGAKKDSSNPFFKSNYADLGSVWEACRQPLAKNGLSVAQLPAESNGGVTLITILMHSSGEYIKSQYSVPCKPDAQSVGSAITYMRRYALAAAVGIYAEDDDGNAASQPTPKQANKPASPPAQKQTPPQGEQVPTVVTVRDLIAELKSQLATLDNVTDDSLLTAINATSKGQAYLTAKGKPLGFGTELAPSTYDAIKGQVLNALNKKDGEDEQTYTSHYNEIKRG